MVTNTLAYYGTQLIKVIKSTGDANKSKEVKEPLQANVEQSISVEP